MGFYIQTDSTNDKTRWILHRFPKALRIPQPKSFDEVFSSDALICVVDNNAFEAAGIAFNAEEFRAFSLSNDTRPKQWLVIPKIQVLQLLKTDDANYLTRLWFPEKEKKPVIALAIDEDLLSHTDYLKSQEKPDEDVVDQYVLGISAVTDHPFDDQAFQSPIGGESGGAGASGDYGDTTDASGVSATSTDDNTAQAEPEARDDPSQDDSVSDGDEEDEATSSDSSSSDSSSSDSSSSDSGSSSSDC